MRHWLLALMIALLPIRGWMSDAMAVAMLAPPAHTMNQAGTPEAAPCPDHAMASDTTASHEGGGEHTHKSCDVCNGPAMALPTPAVPALAMAHGVLAPPAERFASTEPHRGTKPPIS